MSQEYSIRFEPASGAKSVRADAYIQAVAAILEGLNALRASLGPELAAKHGWPMPQVRDALTFSVGPTAKGSLVVPLVPGGVEKGPPLGTDAIAQAFWRDAAAELGRVPKGRAIHLSATGAEAFARASSAASTSHAKLSLAVKAARGTWRSVAPITPIERALRRHAESRRSAHRATTSLSGQIISLTFDPPGFILCVGTTRHSIRMPSTLRDRARESWGREVVVLTDAAVSADGGVADIHALDIQLAASAKQAEDQFDQTFGLMRGAWDSDALKSHLGLPNRH